MVCTVPSTLYHARLERQTDLRPRGNPIAAKMPKPLRKTRLKRGRTRRTTHPISDTYDQILAVAEQEFANSGYKGTSLEVIARRTGIRKASLFHHFNSKRKIFDAVVRRIFDQLVSFGSDTAHIESLDQHLAGVVAAAHDFVVVALVLERGVLRRDVQQV